MQRKRKVRKIVRFAFFIVLVFSLIYFGEDYVGYYKVKKENNNIKEEVVKESKGKKERFTIDWDKLHSINPDIVAWIRIPNTKVSYPVVQTKDNLEYLTKSVKGSYSIYGAIFLDERLYGTKLGENPNNIIYGHNMGRWTDVMFSSLRYYLQSDYLKGHDKVILYTPKKNYKYRVSSVEYADASSSVYYIDFKQVYYSKWVNKQISKSIYKCLDIDYVNSYLNHFKENGKLGKKVHKYGNALSLSTCDTTHDDRKKIVLFCIPET